MTVYPTMLKQRSMSLNLISILYTNYCRLFYDASFTLSIKTKVFFGYFQLQFKLFSGLVKRPVSDIS